MVRIRKFAAYQRIERPYTRISKYKKKSFVKVRPHSTIVRFEHGDQNGRFDLTLYLVSKQDVQVRHNALESARQTSNRVLEKLGKNAYFMRIRKYPFHILRENPLASGAGADRMSTGMSHSFGKPISSAAQVFKEDIVMEVRVSRKDGHAAKLALERANKKLPCACKIIEAKGKKVVKPVPAIAASTVPAKK
ncbi:50S ribosomal protein L16 [Candidatus Woesearchaeota archaeon]|nr:50S ribosomal protein L16 [Candidatus Woesearchaeota archaeon]